MGLSHGPGRLGVVGHELLLLAAKNKVEWVIRGKKRDKGDTLLLEIED